MLSVKLHSMLQNILDLNFKITYFICYLQKDTTQNQTMCGCIVSWLKMLKNGSLIHFIIIYTYFLAHNYTFDVYA